MSTRMISYADYVAAPWKRALIRSIELVSGSKHLDQLYATARWYIANGWDVWQSAMQILDIRVIFRGFSADKIPAKGPLVIIANHPFGLIDGITVCHLVERVRKDFKILINDVLGSVEEIQPYLLPIDFRATKDALETNIQSRNEAMALLKQGGCVVVFPGGGISTTQSKIGRGRAVDAQWKTFTAKMVQSSDATVVPIYFHGQNSWLFQFVSQFSLTLRLSLIVKEVRSKIGTEISVTIGKPIGPDDHSKYRNRRELTAFLRQKTYELGQEDNESK